MYSSVARTTNKPHRFGAPRTVNECLPPQIVVAGSRRGPRCDSVYSTEAGHNDFGGAGTRHSKVIPVRLTENAKMFPSDHAPKTGMSADVLPGQEIIGGPPPRKIDFGPGADRGSHLSSRRRKDCPRRSRAHSRSGVGEGTTNTHVSDAAAAVDAGAAAAAHYAAYVCIH